MSFLSTIAQGESANYQAQVAANQANVAKRGAAYAAGATATNTEVASLRSAQKLSGAKAATAANNIDTGSGSAADVLTGQRQIGQIDASNTAARGALATYGYEQEAVTANAQSKLDEAEASEASWAAPLSAAGTALQLATDIPGGGIGGDFSSLLKDAGGDLSGISGPQTSSVPSSYSWMQNNGGGSLDDEEAPY